MSTPCEFIQNFTAVMDSVIRPSLPQPVRLYIANYSIELKKILRHMFLVVDYFPAISNFCGAIEIIGTHGNRENYTDMIKLLGTTFEGLPEEIQHVLNTSFNFRLYVKTRNEMVDSDSHMFPKTLSTCPKSDCQTFARFYYNNAVKILRNVSEKHANAVYGVRLHMLTKAAESGSNKTEIRSLYSHLSSELHRELEEEWEQFAECFRCV